MAWFENAVEGIVEGGAVGGVAVGLGVLLLAPRLLPVVGRALRPIAVGAIKTGMTVYNEAAATVRETTDDLMAEARAEMEAEEHHGGERTRRRGRSAEATAS